MLEKFLLSTENLFDKKLKNWTLMVLIISACVVSVWAFNQTVNANLQANVLSANNAVVPKMDYVMIWGKKYRVILKEVE